MYIHMHQHSTLAVLWRQPGAIQCGPLLADIKDHGCECKGQTEPRGLAPGAGVGGAAAGGQRGASHRGRGAAETKVRHCEILYI